MWFDRVNNYWAVEVSFSQSSYGVMEDDGRATLMITLSQPSSVEFTVTINTTDVTAKGKCKW